MEVKVGGCRDRGVEIGFGGVDFGWTRQGYHTVKSSENPLAISIRPLIPAARDKTSRGGHTGMILNQCLYLS